MSATDFTTTEGLRLLLVRLHYSGPDTWKHDEQGAELLEFAMNKYRALARKHGLAPQDVGVAAFQAMRTRAVRAAALYRELKDLLTEDAARRQQASRFGASKAGTERPAGGPDSGPPQMRHGKTGRQAAKLVTHTASHTRLEQICKMEQIAADRDQPVVVRKVAKSELEQIRQGGAVDPAYQHVKATLQAAATQQTGDSAPEDLDALAQAALARAKQDRARRIRENRLKRAATAQSARRSVRSFVLTWADLQNWTEHYNAAEVGQQLSDADWVMFERIIQQTWAFADTARNERGLKSA